MAIPVFLSFYIFISQAQNVIGKPIMGKITDEGGHAIKQEVSKVGKTESTKACPTTGGSEQQFKTDR